MKHGHVAIFNVPFPTTVNPSLPIVTTLVRRGYRVTYVVSDRYESDLAALGAEIQPTPRLEFPYDQVSDDTLPIEQQYATDLFGFASRTLQATADFFAASPPDLILYEPHAFAGRVVAKKAGAPAIRIASNLAFDRDTLTRMTLSPALLEAICERRRKVDDFLRQQGIDLQDAIFNRDEVTIYFYLQELQLSPHEGDRLSLYAGRCAAERPNAPIWRRTAPDSKLTVLLTGSTTHVQSVQYYRKCLEALAGLPCHIVLSLGGGMDVSLLDPLPAQCEIVRGTPLCALMPHVDLLVGFGGMATTMEALYHGLAQLMLSNGVAEGEWYADNVEKHGLGVHLTDAKATVESIRESVETIARDATMRANVKRMQTLTRRSSGGEEVVNWLEERMGSGESGCALFAGARAEH